MRVDTKYIAKRVTSSCHGAGIINAATGQPVTSNIDRSMVSKMATIAVPKQRELIKMLFYWEEELVRWRLLCEEESRLQTRLDALGSDSDERVGLKESIRVAQAKKRVPPSLRDKTGHSAVGKLPKYTRCE